MPKAKRPNSRPSDSWDGAVSDLLNFADKISQAHFHQYARRLCIALNKAGYQNYSVAIGEDKPFPADPPAVQTGALKTMETVLQGNFGSGLVLC